MPGKAASTDTRRNRFLEWACDQLPNCSKAIELAETGIQRDLSLKERVLLRYNGRLCPFCACATGKFEATVTRMREAQAERQ